MTEESLLTPELRAQIGRTGPVSELHVTPTLVRRAMEVYLGRIAPLPADGEPVPGFVLAALEPETDFTTLPTGLPNSLLIANEWQFERPLRMGETFAIQSRLGDISERLGGRFGYSLYVRSEVEVRDPDGTLVARSLRTMMMYDPAQASAGEDEE